MTERLATEAAGRPVLGLSARLTRAVLVVGGVGLMYTAATAVLSVRRHLWFDELFTYYIVRQPQLGDVLDVLRTGVEPLPPFFYLVTRGSVSLFGEGSVGIRLPGMLGLLLACVCLYVVVARRSTPLHGAIAMFVPLVTTAYAFATEARPYGMVLGFSAAALLCWQLRCDDVGGRAPAVGLAVTLALATASHYYAVFVLVPLALGEAARTRLRRRFDVAVVGAFVVALVPLLASAPFIRATRELSPTFWAKPQLESGIQFFGWLVRTAAIPPERVSEGEASAFVVAALAVATYVLVAPLPSAARSSIARSWLPATIGGGIAVAGAAALSERDLAGVVVAGVAVAGLGVVLLARRTGAAGPPQPLPEVVAAAGFAFVPLLSVLVASGFTGAYVHRYAITGVIAPAVLLPLALHRLDPRRGAASLVVALLAAALFLVVVAYEYRDADLERSDQRHAIALVRRLAAEHELPVAVAHPHEALELARYAPPAVRARIFAIAGPDQAQRLTGSNSTEVALLELARLTPLRVEQFDQYAASNRPFLVLWRAYFRDWLLPALRASGRDPRPLEIDRGWTVYLVPKRER